MDNTFGDHQAPKSRQTGTCLTRCCCSRTVVGGVAGDRAQGTWASRSLLEISSSFSWLRCVQQLPRAAMDAHAQYFLFCAVLMGLDRSWIDSHCRSMLSRSEIQATTHYNVFFDLAVDLLNTELETEAARKCFSFTSSVPICNLNLAKLHCCSYSTWRFFFPIQAQTVGA